MGNTKIDMMRDFSRYPAGRYRTDGPNSGEKFRDDKLLPLLLKGEAVVVNLNSALAYGSSFLEEAFGGLIRAGLSKETVHNLLTLEARDQSLLDEIESYIQDAARQKNG